MSNATILASFRESPLAIDEIVNGELWTNIGGLYRLLVDQQTPGHEIMYGFQWLMSVLNNDSTLLGYAPGGVVRGLAPSGALVPFVVLIHQAGTDVLTMNAFRLMSSQLYQVKAVGPAGMTTQLVSAASRIDALIGSPPTSGTV